MEKIAVNFDDRSYDIHIGEGAISVLPFLLRDNGPDVPSVVLTDTNVWSFCGAALSDILQKSGIRSIEIAVTPGERAKSIEVFTDIVTEISEKTRGYKPFILAFGGGVVGDLAGFIASSYRRGVPLIHIPTTLLAQVDSSIGGKTGLDLPGAKNVIGSFYQPGAVISDTTFLKSLPARQVRSGMAEIIKYAVIASPHLFDLLAENMDRLLTLDSPFLETAIKECAGIKAGIVEKDEFDTGDIRISLNFGHTFAHAIESASEFSGVHDHGEAVAIGMLIAAEIARIMDIFPKECLVRLKQLILRAGLPTKPSGVPSEDILSTYGTDKKFIYGINRFVLPTDIGNTGVYENIPENIIRTAVDNVYSAY